MTPITLNQVQYLTIAYFGRPADPASLSAWPATGLSQEAVVLRLVASDEYKINTIAANTTGNALDLTGLIDTYYRRLFGRNADSSEITAWTNALATGAVNVDYLGLTILNAVLNLPASTDPNQILTAKYNSAQLYTGILFNNPATAIAYNSAAAIANGIAYLNAITTSTTATLAQAQASINALPAGGSINGQTFSLSIIASNDGQAITNQAEINSVTGSSSNLALIGRTAAAAGQTFFNGVDFITVNPNNITLQGNTDAVSGTQTYANLAGAQGGSTFTASNVTTAKTLVIASDISSRAGSSTPISTFGKAGANSIAVAATLPQQTLNLQLTPGLRDTTGIQITGGAAGTAGNGGNGGGEGSASRAGYAITNLANITTINLVNNDTTGTNSIIGGSAGVGGNGGNGGAGSADTIISGGNTFTNKTTANGLGNDFAFGVNAIGTSVYAGTINGLGISTDSGATFTNKTTANGLGNNRVNGVFAVGTTVYAATQGGLSISTDGGATFINKTTTNGLGNNLVNGVYAVGTTVYAATQGGLSISTDSGATFITKTTANGLGSNIVFGVYASGATVYAGTLGGLAISTDGGATFTNKDTTNGLGDSQVRGVYLSGGTVYAATLGGVGVSSATIIPGSSGTTGGNGGSAQAAEAFNNLAGQALNISGPGALTIGGGTRGISGADGGSPFGSSGGLGGIAQRALGFTKQVNIKAESATGDLSIQGSGAIVLNGGAVNSATSVTAGTLATAGDVIVSGSGNDTTVGGGGADVITTGSGADQIAYITGNASEISNQTTAAGLGGVTDAGLIDRITDFAASSDKIRINTGNSFFSTNQLTFSESTLTNVSSFNVSGTSFSNFNGLLAAFNAAVAGGAIASSIDTAQAYVFTTGTITGGLANASNQVFLVINNSAATIENNDFLINITGSTGAIGTSNFTYGIV